MSLPEVASFSWMWTLISQKVSLKCFCGNWYITEQIWSDLNLIVRGWGFNFILVFQGLTEFVFLCDCISTEGTPTNAEKCPLEPRLLDWQEPSNLKLKIKTNFWKYKTNHQLQHGLYQHNVSAYGSKILIEPVLTVSFFLRVACPNPQTWFLSATRFMCESLLASLWKTLKGQFFPPPEGTVDNL